MQYSQRLFGWALAGGCALLIFSGCSNAGSSSQPPVAANSLGFTPFVSLDAGIRPAAGAGRANGLVFVDPTALKAQIYVAEYNSSTSSPVQDFNAVDKNNKKAICHIDTVGEGVNSIAVDGSHELWVPQALDLNTSSSDVLSFGPNCGAAGTTLVDPKGQAAGIAFASDGTRYVDDILGPSSSAGNVSVYSKGKTKPARYLTNPNIFLATGVGVDSKNNVYVSYHSSASATGILSFKGGKMPGKPIAHVNLGAPGILTFDKKDDMIVTDDVNLTLNVYAPPYTGAPKVFPLQGASPQCSLNAAQTNLACGDKTNASVDIYSYPGGKYEYSFNKGLDSGTVIGVAQDPI
ncbi:MAG TPA: hypothetical protein VIJ77_11870 [Candidatus Tumulicola sp.]